MVLHSRARAALCHVQKDFMERVVAEGVNASTSKHVIQLQVLVIACLDTKIQSILFCSLLCIYVATDCFIGNNYLMHLTLDVKLNAMAHLGNLAKIYVSVTVIIQKFAIM